MNLRVFLTSAVFSVISCTAFAQVNASDSVFNKTQGSRLSIGGYGEIAYSRNFYSSSVYKYANPDKYKNDPSFGRFDIPHAVIYLGYNFGKGWTMGTEIEFEHGGTGVSYEREYEEGGEWESEVEKGGEVELEQFWIQKSFSSLFNLRFGHIVVPVGLNNAHHEPLNFFTVYRPEGENTIIPSTWHQTGVSLWGYFSKFKYEVQFLGGLDAMNFDRDRWIQKGTHSAFEFEPATKYAVAGRLDYFPLDGLRLGVSGYYGHSINNSMVVETGTTQDLKGAVSIGSADFTMQKFNCIVRGQFTYGHLGDAYNIKYLPGRGSQTSPYSNTEVGENAIATGIEAGYNCFSLLNRFRDTDKKLFVFGRYEYYNPYIKDERQADFNYESKRRVAVGLNYFPLKQIVLKMDYSLRLLKTGYNNEPSINFGIAYEGFFL